MTVLELQAVSRRYRRRGHPIVQALAPTTLSVEAGEIVGVSGRSGSGKSTLLRLALTVEAPDSGTVRLLGTAVTRPRLDGTVMPVFQDSRGSLSPRLALWRTIVEPARANGGTAAGRTLAADLLARVGLAELDLDARPAQLSGGQAQRVALARALAARPRLLVADEPTSALDPSVAAGILRLLRDVADAGVAILVASHDRAVLDNLADRTLTVTNVLPELPHR